MFAGAISKFALMASQELNYLGASAISIYFLYN